MIFDFDGTVADTWRDIATALNETLREVGLAAVSGPDVRYWIGDGALKLLERAIPAEQRTREFVEQLYEAFRVHYDRCCLDTTETYPGMVEALDTLSHLALAVLSNKPSRFLDRVIAGLGLKDYFRLVLGGDALPAKKPDPQTVANVLERIGVEPERVYFVGDSAVDVETGRGAGAVTIGCTWGLRGRDELRRAGADHLIETPRQLPPIIAAH